MNQQRWVQSPTASQAVKAAGLKSLKQVSEITGISPQTLINYHNHPKRAKLWNVILAGCLAIVNDGVGNE